MILSRPHVLFDLDGTPVDTRAAVRECYARVFRAHLGRSFPPEGVAPGELFAMRPAELFAAVAPGRAEELYDAYQQTYPGCVDLITVFPGVADLIAALRAAGARPGLVTNKGLARSRIDLAVAGLSEPDFCTIVTAEDTEDRKPHPAPILLALARTGARADQAVYVGDGPQDILAARAAGMPCLAVSYGFYAPADLAQYVPEALVDDVPTLARALGVTLPEAVR